MKAIILGGDGFCGWPNALYLSKQGHDVTIVDNLPRREIDVELEVESLTPIRPIGERIRVWKELSGKDIKFENFTVGLCRSLRTNSQMRLSTSQNNAQRLIR